MKELHPPGIAIIGMGCIFPKSCNLKEYWRLLFNGLDAIQSIPEHTHWQLKDYFNEDPAFPDHTYCTRGGFLPQISFDPLDFGIPPNNLDATDTSQLLGLEVARMALEDAGYPGDHPALQKKRVNVILGVTGTQELVIPLGARLGHPIWKDALEDAGIDESRKRQILDRIQQGYAQWQENSFPGLLGNVVAGRIANRFNLSGTNTVSDAACASSLSALHTAVMELSAHKCDMSITGGVDTLNDIFMHMCFSKTGVLSHTSDARPFSKDADGTVLGEGVGMLVLKRLADAERDGNRIYAVIKGMGTSSDGRTSAIYAPEAGGQVRALKDAYQQARIDPASVELLEAHGTGTRVGDKVEFTALKSCFDRPERKNRTAIGSVKSMIGHTKAAAGAAGIIKAALALHHKVLPPTLKAKEPDPDLEIRTSSFYLNHSTKPWVALPDSPRRSGVSAFGFGGSNFHAVLEEYVPEKEQVSWDGSVQIIAFSAPHIHTLKERLRDFFDAAAPDPLRDQGEQTRLVAWLAQESRKNFLPSDACRLLMVAGPETHLPDMMNKAVDILEKEDPVISGSIFFGKGAPKGKLGFLFPGQGSQYTGMGKDLFSLFPEAMNVLTQANAAFFSRYADRLHKDLNDYLFPLPPHAQDPKAAETDLRQTWVAQPAIGALSLAMTDILARFGIRPDMACGHSFGELCALYAAGWLDGRNLAELAAARGDFMARAGDNGREAGAMLAVQAPVDNIEALVETNRLDLVLANKNSPAQGVLSGAKNEIDKALNLCRKKKMRAAKLPVAAAFHSSLVADAAKPFKDFLDGKPVIPTPIPVLSNTTGTFYGQKETEIKSILGHQLMHPVNFTDNISTMHENGISIFLEVGPKSVLTGLVKRILDKKDFTAISLDASAGKKSGLADLADVLCSMASKGFKVDLTKWEDPVQKPASKRMRVMLSGANPKPEYMPPPIKPVQPVKKTPPQTENKIPEPTTQPDRPGYQAAAGQGAVMHPSSPDPIPSIVTPAPGAVHLISKGLEAMQQLQAQTARAHEKFLETQAQATQTLAAMMEQTRGYAATGPAAPPLNGSTPSVAPAVSAPAGSQLPSPPPGATPGGEPKLPAEDSSPAKVKAPIGHPEVQASKQPAQEHGEQTDKVRDVLFETVSRLTGFPAEMLEPDMDIESDLGIDSIKKVEIVSELEKQLPESPGLTTENIGSVRTLADICRAISSELPQDSRAGLSSESGNISSGTNSPAGHPPESSTPDPVFTVLVDTVSELTGFPKEMLEPGMNLESDLGIDSIKRVEIISKLEQELPECRNLSPDDMSQLQTIGDIVDFLSDDTAAQEKAPVKKNASLRDKTQESSAGPENSPPPLLRQTVVLERFPIQQVRFYNGAKIELPQGKKVYITRDNAGIARAFQKEFSKQRIPAELIHIDDTTVLSDAAGIVIVQDRLDPSGDTAGDFLKAAFRLIHTNSTVLTASAREKSAFLAGVTFLGGGFGFNSTPITCDAGYGGLPGLIKTAGLEWTNVLCRALDLPSDVSVCRMHSEAAVDLMMTHGGVEMGLDGECCNIPKLTDASIPKNVPDLNPSDVVVITGGAKGVTAACSVELARTCSPAIILLGRSGLVSGEPEWAKGLTDAPSLKKAILTHGFPDQKPKPADIEDRYHAICANREIQQTLTSIRDHGAKVKYVSVDIRDSQALSAELEEIREEFGPITAIVHGAGVLMDKFIVDKQPEQFDRVFDTKVQGLKALLAATRTDPVKYRIFFSSVAARSGNVGQCDYAAANEVLNKTARQLNQADPACQTISINWGPWDGGMVNDTLKKSFIQKGIGLIPLKAGAELFVNEMAGTDAVEVIIGSPLQKDKKKKKPVLSKVMTCPMSMEKVPILDAHKINGEPVVPFAVLAELAAHAAEKNNPGLMLAGIDELRLLKGIRPKESQVDVQVSLGKCTPGDGHFRAAVELTALDETGKPLHCAQCTAILGNELPNAPVLSKSAFMELEPPKLTIDQAYTDVLFHGRSLQCISDIVGISQKGIEVAAVTAPEPGQWFAPPFANRWVTDPLMLDAAFQTAILWTWETKRQVCLPSYMANFRLYSPFRQLGRNDKIHILFTVNENTDHSVKGYFTFLDENKAVVASITGFEAVIDPTLHDKFKPKPLFERKSILAFAQGKPSRAFGDKYKVFDSEREIARLPRPPYFFMDRVLKADHPQWEMAPGGWIETEYDIPSDAWYFTANRSHTLPFCILLEIALQPCGWLAAYAGSALESENRLYFRNLGGKAKWLQPVTKNSGTLTVRCRMTDVSKAGDMIIQNFQFQVFNQGRTVYEGSTNFGFFTRKSLANQVGIRNSQYVTDDDKERNNEQQIKLNFNAPKFPADEGHSPDDGMPARALLMLDTIDNFSLDGGRFGNGYMKAKKQVNPKEWFFDAHFYQDPVCPGSLGIESFLQMLRFFLLRKFDLDTAMYEAQPMLCAPHEWIYRGQIIPENKIIEVHAHIKDVKTSSGDYWVTADGVLSVDGICIYEMKNMGAVFSVVQNKKQQPSLSSRVASEK